MRALWVSALALLVVAAAGCGSGGKRARCNSDSECATNLKCDTPQAGEQGVCIPVDSDGSCALTCPVGKVCTAHGTCEDRYAITVTQVGGTHTLAEAGGPINVHVDTPANSKTPMPTSIQLTADGQNVGNPITLSPATGPHDYQVPFTPGLGLERGVQVAAQAEATNLGPTTSPAISVPVDTLAPRVTAITPTCGTAPSTHAPPCLRTEKLNVSAEVVDADLNTSNLQMTVDGASLPNVSATLKSGTTDTYEVTWDAFDLSVDSAKWVTHSYALSLTAHDTLNHQTTQGQNAQATRVAWTFDTLTQLGAKSKITTPAVLGSGSSAVFVSGTDSGYLVAIGLDGTLKWDHDLGKGAITASPSVGAMGIWFGGSSGSSTSAMASLCRSNFDGTLASCNDTGTGTGIAVTSTPVILPGTVALSGGGTRNTETAFVGSGAGPLLALQDDGKKTTAVVSSTTQSGFYAAGAISGSEIYFVNQWTLYRYAYTYGDTPALANNDAVGRFPAQVVDSNRPLNNSVPVTVEAAGVDWTVDQGPPVTLLGPPQVTYYGKLRRVVSGTDPTQDVHQAITEPIVYGSDHLLIGTYHADTSTVVDGLHYSSSGNTVDYETPDLLGVADVVRTPVVLRDSTSGTAVQVAMVSTSTGNLYFGQVPLASPPVVWHDTVPQATSLYEGNVFQLAPTDKTSIAFFGSDDGKVYAVIVDGALDSFTNAPWPKARRDPQNTGRAP